MIPISMEELIAKLEWQLEREKSIRNRLLLQSAIENLSEFERVKRAESPITVRE